MKKLKTYKARSQPHNKPETPESNRAAAQAWEARIELLAMQLCPIEEWAQYEAHLKLLNPPPRALSSPPVVPFAPRATKLFFPDSLRPARMSAPKAGGSPGASAHARGPAGTTGKGSIQQAQVRLFPVWRKYRQQAKRVATLFQTVPILKRLPLSVAGWLGDLLFK